MKERIAAYLFWAYCLVAYIYGYTSLKSGDKLFGVFYADTSAMKLFTWSFSPVLFILCLIDWLFNTIAEAMFYYIRRSNVFTN